MIIGNTIFCVENPFKLGVFLDNLTVLNIFQNYPGYGYLQKGDVILGVKVLSKKEKEEMKNYIEKSITLDSLEIPVQSRINENRELEEILDQVRDDDVLLLWVKRENQKCEMYIKAKKELTYDPTIFIDDKSHTSLITKIDINEKNSTLVTASYDKTVKIWDIDDSDEMTASVSLISTLYPPFGNDKEGQILSISVNNYNGDIACGMQESPWNPGGTVYIFDCETKEIKKTLKTPHIAHHLQYSKNGDYLILSLSWGHGIQLYDGKNYELLDQSEDVWNSSSFWCDISPDQDKIVAGSITGEIYLYEICNRKLKLTEIKNTYSGKFVYNTVFSKKGDKIAITFIDDTQNKIDILSAKNLELLYSINTKGVRGSVFSVAWIDNDSKIAAAGEFTTGKNEMYVWNKSGRGKLESVELDTEWISQIKEFNGKIVYASYDPCWGIINGLNHIYRNESTGKKIKNISDKFEISSDGDKIKIDLDDNGNPYVFDVFTRQIYENKCDTGKFEYFPPITTSLNIDKWKDSKDTSLNGFTLPIKENEKSKALAINALKTGFLLGTEWYLRYFDESGNLLWTKPAPGIIYYVNIVKNGEQCVALFSDGTVRWYRTADGQNLINLYIDGITKEWILWTQNGYYSCSQNADEILKWRINTGKESASDVNPFKTYYEIFHNTQLPIRSLAENKSDIEILYENEKKINRIDDYKKPIRINSVNIHREGGKTFLIVETDEANRNFFPRVSINGRIQNKPCYEKKLNIIEIPVELPEKNNNITVCVYSEDGVYSQEKFMSVINEDFLDEKTSLSRKLYLLAIGVDKYEKFRQLDSCAADAEKIIQTISEKRKSIKNEDKIFMFLNDDFHGDNLDKKFKEIEKEINGDDIFIFYYSGHGVLDEAGDKNRFCLMQANGTPLSFEKIYERIKKLNSQNIILFIDACKSGMVTDIYTFSLLEDRLFDLNRKMGVYVFSSSFSKEDSLEVKKLNHGLFTYALINSFYSEDDDEITAMELSRNMKIRMPEISREYLRILVFPKILMAGHDFTIGHN